MGFVYLARDLTLDRVVAIKAIRPELATEAAVARFLREARVLGRIRHPNIVPVHRAGLADGLPYYVMEYVEGETLAERLGRKRMTEREAITTGRALLDALAAAHSAGVVHRDVKPANVFLTGPRVLLGDFGVARVDTTDPDATSTSGHIGTPAYMAPEQAAGGIVTEQSDIYSAGMVIYEMLTGRRWIPAVDPRAAEWSGVPRRYRHALRRALAWDPEHRWTRASAFRRVLAPRYRLMRRVTMSGWLFALLMVMGVVGYWWTRRAREPVSATPPSPSWKLAIVPLNTTVGVDSTLGSDVASAVDVFVSDIPQLDVVPPQTVRRWWNAMSEAGNGSDAARCADLKAVYCTGGFIYKTDGDSLAMRLSLRDQSGHIVRDFPEFRAAAPRAALDFASDAAYKLVDYLSSNFVGQIRSGSALSDDPDAIRKFFLAEDWFFRDQPGLADTLYSEALELDPTFARARWHRIQARRWQPGENADLGPDLEMLAAAAPGRLDRLDSLLVHAQRQPPGRDRIEAYLEVAQTREYQRHPLPWMLWGEEIFHRGPLAGYPFDSATVGLELAVALDSLWPLPKELLLWLHTREGRKTDAEDYLRRLTNNTPTDASGTMAYTGWLRLAFSEKFHPDSAAQIRNSLSQASDAPHTLDLRDAMRMPFAFDMPDVEADYAGMAIGMGPASAVSGHYGLLLADAARGRTASSLAHLYTATTLMRADSADLHAAEWRVIPGALGVHLFGGAERDAGVAALRMLAGRPGTRVRALWALGIGDTSRAGMWRDSLAALPRDSAVRRLLPMLDGIRKAGQRDYTGALLDTDSLLVYDAHGHHGDPFARSALHMLRSRWHEQLGENDAVERDLRWVENMDVTGWPHDQPQAAEIDWVFGVEVSRRRGLLALARGDDATACGHFARVLRFWTVDLAPAIDSLRIDTEQHAASCQK